MALTLSQGFIDAYAAGVAEPVFIVKITTAGGEQIATFGRSSLLTYPESVISVTPVKRSLDILTRAVRVGSLTVQFAKDLWFQNLWTDRLKNQKIEILIGEASMAEVDYEPYFLGVIGGVLPEDDHYTVTASSPMLLAEDFDATGAHVNKHLLEYLEDLLEASNLEASMLVAADFDPTDAAYATTISHWNMSVGEAWYWLLQDPKAARAESGVSLINEVSMLLGGRVYDDELGRIRFTQYDSATAASDTWTDDDMQDFKVKDLHRWLKNRIDMTFCHVDNPIGRHIAEDSSSQSNFAYPGGNDLVISHSMDTRLLTPYAALGEDINSTVSSFTIYGYGLHSMCGTRWPSYDLGGSPAQPASAALSAARLAYLKIDDELIELSGLAVDTSRKHLLQYRDSETGAVTTKTVPMRATVTVKGGAAGRGVKGTSGAAHSAIRSTGYRTIAIDYTIPIYVSEAMLARHANGVPVVEVTTNFSKYNLQVADFVTITTNRYRSYNKTSLATTTKWEIIGKEVEAGVGRTQIKWTLAKATDSTEPAIVGVPNPVSMPLERSWGLNNQSMSANEEVMTNHIVSGYGITLTGGFGYDMAQGLASAGTARTANQETQSLTVNASKDTYIAWDVVSGQAVVYETALGAGTPTLLSGQVWVRKLVSDGAGITGQSDPGTVTTAMSGAVLTPATVDTTQLAPLAVTEGKIDAEAVTTGKVGPYAIGSDQTFIDSIARNNNFDFAMREES